MMTLSWINQNSMTGDKTLNNKRKVKDTNETVIDLAIVCRVCH